MGIIRWDDECAGHLSTGWDDHIGRFTKYGPRRTYYTLIMASLAKRMKQLLLAAWLGLLTALPLFADTAPIFINDIPITSPPDDAPAIDATAWVNRAPFSVSAVNGSGIPLPFEAQNCLLFTNTAPMSCNPGVRFLYNVGPQRLFMDTWTNSSTISTDSALTFSNAFGLFAASFGNFFGFGSQS